MGVSVEQRDILLEIARIELRDLKTSLAIEKSPKIRKSLKNRIAAQLHDIASMQAWPFPIDDP